LPFTKEYAAEYSHAIGLSDYLHSWMTCGVTRTARQIFWLFGSFKFI
jgi:hypothetical protein